MKKLYNIILGFVFASGYSQTTIPPSGISNSENYIYSRTYLEEKSSSDASAKQTQSVTYFDDLGRPKQLISIKSNPSGNDVVTHIEYDGFGRQVKDYLPVPQSLTASGSIFTAPLTSASSMYGTEKIYSEKVLEDSPLDRVFQQIQPGTDWQSHPINYDYQTNSSTDVLKFSVVSDTLNKAFFTYQLKVNGYYPASKLYKNMVSDEDGKTTFEFKNGEGQILMVRKLLGNSDIVQGIAPQPSATYVETYYVYNEYNQLSFIISPLAAIQFRANSNQTINNPKTVPNQILDNLCYQYNYDARSRLVEKKLPGKGWESMVYDMADRLVMTQDSNLATQGKWMISKYDKFGRVAYTGLIPGGTRQSMQVQAGAHVIQEERDDDTGFTKSELQIYYTNNLFVGIESILSVNYYDTYPDETPFPDQYKILNEPILLESYDTLSRSTKSLPLASFVKDINDDNWTKNYSFYDGKGRAIGTTSINHLGGSTVVGHKLDFTGVIKQTQTLHNRIASEIPVNIIEDFVYDEQNRLLKQYHEVVGKTPKELIKDNTYDDLGRLVVKKVGAVSNATFTEVSPALQTVTYQYNIRGWMTGINLNAAGAFDISKLFSYKIKYNDPANAAIKKYNGNISEIDWTYSSNNGSRYEYTYDDLNRLKKAYYKNLNATTTIDSKHFNEELTYDINGNIKTLKRNARPRTGQTATLVDDLKYYYENNDLSNRLMKIADNEGFTANPSGYPGGSGINTYDINGNMLTIPDKGITQNITYNFLNLPQVVTKAGQPVSYAYRADGVKIHKAFTFNNEQIETDYLDGFVYTTPYSLEIDMGLQASPAIEEMAAAGQREALELADRPIVADPGGPINLTESSPNFFPTAEGFYDYENFRYIYQYKDHIGNARLSYGRDENGDLFTEDSNDYYAFGLNFINPVSRGGAQQVYNPSATYKNYKYNGKELQEIGMYDYGARFYMPDIGRWSVVDPLADKHPEMTPFRYSFNNPINATDPTGLLEDWYTDLNGEWVYDPKIQSQKDLKDKGIQGKYQGESARQGDLVYAADGYVYDDSAAGGGLPIANGSVGEIQEVVLKGPESNLSKAWNSEAARRLISDSYTLGLSSNVAAFFGAGTTPINFTLLTRGKEPGIYLTPTLNASAGSGIAGNAGITFGNGTYTGNPREIQSSFLQGHSGGASAGLGLGFDASIGASYAPVDIKNPIKGGGFINFSAQVGVGIEGSPATALNFQLNYQKTPVVTPIYQFK